MPISVVDHETVEGLLTLACIRLIIIMCTVNYTFQSDNAMSNVKIKILKLSASSCRRVGK